MRHRERGVAEGREEFLQPIQPVEIQIVGRLVENEQVGVGEQRFGERCAGSLAAARFGRGRVQRGIRQPHAADDALHPPLIVAVSAHRLVLGEQVGVARFCVPPRPARLPPYVALGVRDAVFHLQQSGERGRHDAAQSPRRVLVWHLRHISDSQSGGRGDRPPVRLQLAHENAEQGSLAATVGADKPYPRPLAHVGADVGERLDVAVEKPQVGRREKHLTRRPRCVRPSKPAAAPDIPRASWDAPFAGIRASIRGIGQTPLPCPSA